MALYSLIFLFQKVVQLRLPTTQALTQNYHSTQPNVFASSSYLNNSSNSIYA